MMPLGTAPNDAFTFTPLDRPVDGTVIVPGSKSITNRALPIAALARGKSTLTGALFSDDTRYMAQALNQLGVRVDADEANNTFSVAGGDGTFPAASADLFIGNSGTSVRFLTAVLALGHGEYRIDGVPRMRQRPIQPLITALNDLGSEVRSEENTGGPPVIVTADGLPGGTVSVPGDKSSQYFSALLIAAPAARDGVEILVEGDLVSKPYMPMTAETMRAFGVEVALDEVDWKRFAVAPGQHYEGRVYHVEPDASNASYFFDAAAVTGGRVRVDGLGKSSTQGDLNFVNVLEAMGATVSIASDYTEVIGPPNGTLRGVDLDLNAISDTAQTLAAIAPFASGPTTIRGVDHERLKESDRVAALATVLR
jgi:3-phosphoshikimate 1-carboxyvinyltransferase